MNHTRFALWLVPVGLVAVSRPANAVLLSPNAVAPSSAPVDANVGVLVADESRIRAGQGVTGNRLQRLPTVEAAARALDETLYNLAYHLKVDKGNPLRWTTSWPKPDIKVSDYVTLVNRDETLRELKRLTYPMPDDHVYRILLTSCSDFAIGTPLSITASVTVLRLITTQSTLLAELTVTPQAIALEGTDVEIGLRAAKKAADVARAKLGAMGVDKRFATGGLGVSEPVLLKLGRLLREGKTVHLGVTAKRGVWKNDFTPVEFEVTAVKGPAASTKPEK